MTRQRSNTDNIVTIDLDWVYPKYKPRYTVVIDWPKEGVLKLAHDNETERTFTLPFYTGLVEDMPDWSDFFEYSYHYLAQPFYVRGVEDIKSILVTWGFENDQ